MGKNETGENELGKMNWGKKSTFSEALVLLQSSTLEKNLTFLFNAEYKMLS